MKLSKFSFHEFFVENSFAVMTNKEVSKAETL